MTPAIKLLKQKRIEYEVLEYEHNPMTKDFGKEAVEKLDLNAHEVFKTLLVDVGEKDFVVCIVPVSKQLNLKEVAKFCKAKKAIMADFLKAQKVTGYLVGGMSPLGQKKRLKTVVDSSTKELEFIYVSGGKRGLDIKVKPHDVVKLLQAFYADISI